MGLSIAVSGELAMDGLSAQSFSSRVREHVNDQRGHVDADDQDGVLRTSLYVHHAAGWDPPFGALLPAARAHSSRLRQLPG
jgi:hypothetical protein